MRVAILGGGIAGLSAAWALEKARTYDPDLEYTLFEASNRLGGSIYTEIVDGCVVEGGPDSFLTEKSAAARLCEELGIAESLVGSNDADRKTYIVVKNKLVPLPDGLMFMVPTQLVPTAMTRLFSLKTKARMALELLLPPRPMIGDESVAEMVARHFGSETVDRLVDPLLSGVYGGDARTLSARAVLARMVEMEEKHGSLCRAMLAAHKRIQATGQPKTPRSMFTTLAGGMQQLVDALVDRLQPSSILLETPLRSVELRAQQWRVRTDSGTREYDALIVALPAAVAGPLFAGVDSTFAAALSTVPYSSSVTVALGFDREDVRSLPDGFGFLVPFSEDRRMRACTFVHAKFPGRCPDDRYLLRCFLGGTRDEGILDRSNEEIEAVVRWELWSILGLEASPRFVRIHRSRQAMAQYVVGHRANAAHIQAGVARLPCLALAGNAYEGIGVPDCIRTGQQAAASVLATMRRPATAAV
jgi:oxygen-dependent protoporphyrinogen oxidase